MSLGGQVRDTAGGGTDRARFVTVMRGYDRIEVDEYVRDTHRSVQRLQTELATARGAQPVAKEGTQNGAPHNGAAKNGSQSNGGARDRK